MYEWNEISIAGCQHNDVWFDLVHDVQQIHRDFHIKIAFVGAASNSSHLGRDDIASAPEFLYFAIQSMLVAWIDRDVAISVDEKAALPDIVEQVVIVQPISF